jgi:hypothetical protein
MYTANLATCQSIYDNVNDDNQFLSLVSSSSFLDDAYLNVTQCNLKQIDQIEQYMSSLDEGCELLTKLLHAAMQSSDVPTELKNQFAEFAVEAGVL